MSPEDPPQPPDDRDRPGGDTDPFAALFRAFGGIPGSGLPGLPGTGGSGGQDPARQMAMAVASEGTSEPNVEPVVRMEYESLVRVAELNVADRTGLTVSRSGTLGVRPVTRAGWASASVDAYRPYLARMTEIPDDPVAGLSTFGPGGIEVVSGDPEDPTTDPSAGWLSGLVAAMAPLMASVTTGTMVGRLATRNLGSYDLPIPREGDEILVVAPNVAAFADDWSLPAEDLRLWICLHEVAHHAVLGVPHLRAVLVDLLSRHAGAFRNDSSELQERLGDVDLSGGPEALARLHEVLDPEMVLGAVRSPEQEELLPRLEALVALVIGYVDHVMDDVGGTLIGSYRQVTEAVRRRRVGTGEADRFVERILGLDLTQEQVDRGTAFVDGVVDRNGADGLARLWSDKRHLPTPAEVDAPGLWLARIDLPENG